jgi:hypothetical protein
VTGVEFHRCLAGVARLAGLEDGWDSYGAPAISPLAVAAAVQTLHEAAELPRPLICPTAGCGIDIEWDHDDVAFLHAECLADGTVRVSVYADDTVDEVVL